MENIVRTRHLYCSTLLTTSVSPISLLPVSVMRRNARGDSTVRKNDFRASAVENWTSALRGPSAMGAWWLFLLTFFFFFYIILIPTECGGKFRLSALLMRRQAVSFNCWTAIHDHVCAYRCAHGILGPCNLTFHIQIVLP